jgi:hypothetical protein
MNKHFSFFRQPSPAVRWLSLIVIALVGTLLTLLLIQFKSNHAPTTVWLPNVNSLSDEAAYYLVPVSSKIAITKYGKAQRFDSTNRSLNDSKKTEDPVTSIYEFSSGVALNEANCPNILNQESLLPSPCHQVGTLKGHPIYAINRRLPSMMAEYFVRLDTVFLFVTVGTDGTPSDSYLKTFERISRDQTTPYLQKNCRRIDQVLNKQYTADANEKAKNAAAYTKLDFAPALPTYIPDGWQQNKGMTSPIELDGPDADHPSLVSVDYAGPGKQFVRFHSGRLSDFTLAQTCGPTPGDGMEKLACVKPVGKTYYESSRTLDGGDMVRTLYYPVGDSLIISQIQVFPEEGKPVTWPTDLANIQDQMTLSSRQVDKSTLKGSNYNAIYYRY